MTTLTFLPYSPSNYRDYLRIYEPYYPDTQKINVSEEYRDQMSRSGFIIGDPNDTDSSLINNSPYHLCAYINNKVVGIIRADRIEKSDNHDANTTWNNNVNQIANAFHEGIGLELGVIMVDQEYKNQGIAKELLNKLTEFMKQENYPYLYSWVVANPPNLPSLSFHKKNGFTKVADYHSQEAFGIKNYESFLFTKPTRF